MIDSMLLVLPCVKNSNGRIFYILIRHYLSSIDLKQEMHYTADIYKIEEKYFSLQYHRYSL